MNVIQIVIYLRKPCT